MAALMIPRVAVIVVLLAACVAACGESSTGGSRVFGEVGTTPTPTATTVVASQGTPAPESEGAVPASLLLNAPPAGGIPSFLTSPLAEWRRLGDGFGAARAAGLVHGGVDLVVDGGSASAVYSPCDGRVGTVSQTQTFGLYVALLCGDGWEVILSNLATANLAVGDAVLAGESVAGTIASDSDEAVLHLAVRFDGHWLDPNLAIPLDVLPGTARPVTPTPTPTPQPTLPRPANPTPVGVTPASATLTPTQGVAETPTPPAASTPSPTPNLTPTRVPTRTPTPTPTPRPPTPTPTQLPQAF